MGRVYLGEHVKMNRQCAIKVMSPALVNDAESAARFAREASNAARIIHPNVAAVFDYGESDGLVYLVMEYVDGEPLSRLLAREAPLALERAVDLARQIADGLGAAHELGIVHRDLKPDNILVTRTQERARGREGRRLRHRQGDAGGRRRGADADGSRHRHARVHEPRAAARRSGRCAQRSLRARLHPPPDAHRPRRRSRRRRASR